MCADESLLRKAAGTLSVMAGRCAQNRNVKKIIFIIKNKNRTFAKNLLYDTLE